MGESHRFSTFSDAEITKKILETTSKNTLISNQSIWRQFKTFTKERNYILDQSTTTATLALILKDWAYNMKRKDGNDYKEAVIKTMWNKTAKLVQELYFNKYNRSFDPFHDIEFRNARNARDAKRKILQKHPEKHKQSSVALSNTELLQIFNYWDEDTPCGLQRKFFHVASYELAWRGGEATKCLVHYFKKETDIKRLNTGRIEYNPIFTKTAQGGAQRCANSKWLTPNINNPDICPVRLFEKLMSKREENIKTERLFLTPNPAWQTHGFWYKNVPVGINSISKWMKESAEKVGLDTVTKKITNHSARSSAVSNLSKAGVGEQELIKVTGHNSASSIKPYLQLNQEHHSNIINNLRENTQEETLNITSNSKSSINNESRNIFNNCVFHCTNLNC